MAVNESQFVPEDARWSRSVEWLTRATGVAGGVALGVLVLNIVIDVIGRTVFNTSLPGTLDLVTFWWMPVVALLPLGLSELRKEHVSVDILAEKVSGRHRGAIEVFGCTLAIVVVGALTYFTLDTTVGKIEIDEAAVSSTWLPIWPIRILALLALVTFVLQLLITLRQALRRATGADVRDHKVGG
jgi:TRAP-type C4-dicarboxylate transport system permease small subunit